MELVRQLILIVLIGGIIGLALAAWMSMRGSSRSGPVMRDIREPDDQAPQRTKQELLTPRQSLRPMHERQAELHARMRQQTGHVDTVMIMLPPKDGDAPKADPPR